MLNDEKTGKSWLEMRRLEREERRKRKRSGSRGKLLGLLVLVILIGIVSWAIIGSSSTGSSQQATVQEHADPKQQPPSSSTPVAVGLEVGNLAPDFQLTDITGLPFSRNSLAGKPVFIFFTTTWCVPCQVGAKELLKYDLETGDRAFNIVIVFVDSKETNEQIKQWKDQFGGRDWFTALDTTGMASRYQVKFLDTKYVLDKNGVIVWNDVVAPGALTYRLAKDILQQLIS